MLNQSFRQVFVTNTPNLLASGTTVDLGVGQVGIFDGATYSAVTSPTYAKNKALYFGWGNTDLSGSPLMLGISSNTELSKLIKGKNITGFRGHKASRGRTEVMTVGYDGVDVTKTLCAKCGETKVYYLTLSGQPIRTLYADQITQQYHVEAPHCKDCVQGDENCENVCAEGLADSLVAKINADPKVNRFVRAKKLINCNPARAAVTGAVEYTRYTVAQQDAGDSSAFGGVQSQYPGKTVKVKTRTGNTTTYEIVQPTSVGTPAALSNLNNVVISDCPTCPAGYTTVASGFVYTVVRQDGNVDATNTIKTDYATTSVTRLNDEFGAGTYLVIKATAINSAVGADALSFKGQARQSCVLTSPSTTAWTAQGTLTAFPQKYSLTILDQCNTNRLADVQRAFPSLVVSQTASTPSDSCAHRYETTVLSNPLESDCGLGQLVYKAPSAFEGINWEVIAGTAPSCTGCVAGVRIEASFVHRTTNEITYDYFTKEYDGVHLEGSEYNPDYNGKPFDDCSWPTTYLQKITYPHGDGFWVRKEEIKSKAYTHLHRSMDPGVREAEGYNLESKLDKFYDEYTIEFSFSYNVLGWSDKYTDNYHLTIYVPEGQGKQLESAVNAYLASANINIDPVVL